MKTYPLSRMLTLLLIAVAFSGGYVFGQSSVAPVTFFGAKTTTPPEAREEFAPFWEVWNLVQTRYFDQPVDDARLMEGAIDGMLASLDDTHTRYLSPIDEASARETLEGEFQGIGAEVEEVDGTIVIVSPLDGSPAEAAGLLPGDIIRQADGVDLSGLSLDEAVLLVRGPAGTTVDLVIERDAQLFQVSVIRDVIQIASVRGELLESRVAYVRLSRFGNRTIEELEDTLTVLMARDPIGLVLDLRRNPGGSLDTVVDVADEFLAAGPVLIERFGDGFENVFESDDTGLAQEVPMVVLVDEGSASASEVLAGAIRDRNRGVLIGQTTFGKGTVQTWHTLSNGGGVRITVARWLTPEGNWVHQEGLVPDYLISLPPMTNDEEFEDAQLQAAVDFLLGRSVTSGPNDIEG